MTGDIGAVVRIRVVFVDHRHVFATPRRGDVPANASVADVVLLAPRYLGLLPCRLTHGGLALIDEIAGNLTLHEAGMVYVTREGEAVCLVDAWPA